MATAVLTARPARVPTASYRTAARVAGWMYLVTFITSIPARVLYTPVLDKANYILGTGSVSNVLLGSVLDVICALAGIGTAIALFPVVRRQNESLAIGFVASRVLEASALLVGAVTLFSVVTLRQDLAGATGTSAASLLVTGHALVAVHTWVYLVGPGLLSGVNALLLGTLMYRSGLVPRIIPLVGLIGAPLLLASGVATMFGAFDQFSVWGGIAGAPVAVWELSVGCWMAFKGFKPSPITAS